MLNFGSFAFLLFCVFENLFANGIEFARPRRIVDSPFTRQFQGALRASPLRMHFGTGGSSVDSSFTPRFQEVLGTSSWRGSDFGPGGSSTGSSFMPRFQVSRPSSSRRSLLGPGGSSSELSMPSLLSFRRRNDGFRPEVSSRTSNFSPMHFNRRQSTVFNNADRASILERLRRYQRGKSSREVFDQSIQSTQPDNSVRHTSIMIKENRPSSNIASILQRLRSRTSVKSSKEVNKSPIRQRNPLARHQTVPFLENRPPKQTVVLTLAKTAKNSKEVKDSSLQSVNQESLKHPIVSFLDKRRPPSQVNFVSVKTELKEQKVLKTSKEIKDQNSNDRKKSVNQERTLKHPIVSFLDKRRPQSQVNFVSVKTELKEQKVRKTSKEIKPQNNKNREIKMKKVRQLLQLMPENQRYKFLMSLRSAAGMKTSAEKNTKLEYPEVPIQTKLSPNPNVFRKSTAIERTRPKKNKKKTSAEKKLASKHNMQENTDESLQRILLLKKLNNFLRQQLNHDSQKQKSEQTMDSSKRNIKTSKEVTRKSNQHRRTHHIHRIHNIQQPQSNTVQTQNKMPQLSLESTRLAPHRRRVELLARLNSRGLSTSSKFGNLLTNALNSNVNHASKTSKQSKLSNINPFSSDSLKLLDQNDVLDTSKEKKNEEKFTWENP